MSGRIETAVERVGERRTAARAMRCCRAVGQAGRLLMPSTFAERGKLLARGRGENDMPSRTRFRRTTAAARRNAPSVPRLPHEHDEQPEPSSKLDPVIV